MAKLITDFFCVGTAGATVDGRTLHESWFKDAAKHYDQKLYASRIWYEHYRFYGAWGDVVAVKTKKDEDGTLKLYNRVQASTELIDLWKSGQKLYSSIEVYENFAKRGHSYQIGLGITDSPASLGTDRQEFSAFREHECFGDLCKVLTQRREEQYKSRITEFQDKDDIHIFVTEALPDIEFKKENKIFDFGLGSLFGGNTDKNKPTTTDKPKDTTEMNKEEIAEAIAAGLKPFSDRLDDIEKKFNAQSEDSDAGTDGNATDSGNDGDGSEDHYKELNDKMDTLSTQFTNVLEKFKQKDADDDHRDEVDGSNDMPDFL